MWGWGGLEAAGRPRGWGETFLAALVILSGSKSVPGMFLIPGSRPCAGGSRPGPPGRLRAPHRGCRAAAPRRAPQPRGPTEGLSPRLHRDLCGCGGRGVGSGRTHGCPSVGDRLQPHAGVGVRLREHSGTPLLPADAVFLAPAKDTPAAHRPPGVWHSRASAVSRQQPPPGAQHGSTSGAAGRGLSPRGSPGARQAQSRGGRADVCTRVCVQRADCTHARALACRCGGAGCGRLVCKERAVQGAGCARSGLARSRAVAVGARRPHGCDGRAAAPQFSPRWVLPDAPCAAGAVLAALGGTGSNLPAPTSPLPLAPQCWDGQGHPVLHGKTEGKYLPRAGG